MKITLKDTLSKKSINYLVGNWRFFLYYSLGSFGIRKHILEQIVVRLNTIAFSPCYMQGSCVHCGCEVPQLTMCSDICHGNCYPIMLNKKEWKLYKDFNLQAPTNIRPISDILNKTDGYRVGNIIDRTGGYTFVKY